MGLTEGDHEGAPGPARLIVPDDASALEPDRLAWLAEQRALRRRQRLRRLLFTRRWERFGLSGPLVVLCLMLTAVVGGLTVMFVPRPRTPGPAPLASAAEIPLPSPQANAGSIAAGRPDVEVPGGGVLGLRLPAIRLDGDVRQLSAADLRPAVLVLAPPDCQCEEAVHAAYRQAREFRLAVWLIGSPRPGEPTSVPARRRLAGLDEAGAAGGARWAVDPAGALAAVVAARRTTLIAVRADGAVAGLRRDLPLDAAQLPALEPLLAKLISPNR